MNNEIEEFSGELAKLRKENEVFHDAFHYLHTHAQITMNYEKVTEMMSAISGWSYAHRSGNGELTEEEQQARVDLAFTKIKQIVRVE
jgi:hypothetical protein